ncbi:hypothetical protein TSACC_21562 [Terrimicrobium sacchariphilum]|jgi:gluconokinase|uniref:DUF5069 domain-containing protein n=1 Tax=Terrimicrobium sacchariphilum TaxID=690879 RepID=A0A146G715_TERSA|nr:DUF5069 domain-containing protein [Terrimicrobium sacchariphilum]GAT33153.1 hypothetical protein TSACC_21562 [Terrimicrobium sacchariphilum]
MTIIPELRSPSDPVGGLVFFGRTCDKIRLLGAGKLPELYLPFLGKNSDRGMDSRVCRLLQVNYRDLEKVVLDGASDEAALAWAFQNGTKPTDEEIEIFNAFVQKRGWRDEATSVLRKSVAEAGYPADQISTFVDYIDYDEGRPLKFAPDPAPPTKQLPAANPLPELISPHTKLGGVVYLARMISKIRLHEKGGLPPAWVENLGAKGSYFDGRICRFLGVEFEDLAAQVKAGASDEEVLAWTRANGRKFSEDALTIWNAFMTKRGWRDAGTATLTQRLEEAGYPAGAALTMFDFIDLDEGRPLVSQGA